MYTVGRTVSEEDLANILQTEYNNSNQLNVPIIFYSASRIETLPIHDFHKTRLLVKYCDKSTIVILFYKDPDTNILKKLYCKKTRTMMWRIIKSVLV